jgi:gliding motility-associated protein GldL
MALLSKKAMNFSYGMGAAVVIIGALFKIQHYPGAGILLIIGLCTEALIFGLSAFDPVDVETDWSLVYPELKPGGVAKQRDEKSADTQGILSQKLDIMLKEAKIDGELMSSLGNSIRNFEAAAKGIAPSVDAMASTKKYSDELVLAASHMESLNASYKLQLQSADKHTQATNDIAEHNIKLKDQMQSLSSNLSSLNNVYGGMLSAMSNK